MASLISIGVNGLLSHQSAINTTGNNITNANTPGYSRQRVELATLPEYRSGNGYMGQGSSVVALNRVVDQILIKQLRTDTSSFHQIDTLTTFYSQLDGLLADSSTGLAPALQGFFDSLQQASLDPTSIPIRQVVLGSAGTLAQRFGSLYDQLQTQEKVINEQLGSLTGQVTSLAQGIASLNQQISQQTSTNAQPNALLDKRDELARQLSELVGADVIDQGNGMINVMIGSGQPLVVGNQAYALSTQPSATDASRSAVVFQGPGVTQEIGQFLTGGQIGGMLRYRSEALDKSFNHLGQMALSIAEHFNTVQAAGMDLDGEFGAQLQPLFADLNSSALMGGRAAAMPGNDGTAALNVAITRAANLTGGEYLATWNAAGSEWVVTTQPGSKVVDPAAHGFDLSLRGGAPQNGDSFLVRPTRDGADAFKVALTDPRDLALAQPAVRIGEGATNSGMAELQVVSNYPAPRLAAAGLAGLFPANTPIEVRVGAGGVIDVDIDGATLSGALPPGGNAVLTVRAATAPATGYQLIVESEGAVSTDPADLLRFTLSGSPTTGDAFTASLHATPNGTSDNGNALAMLDLRFDKLVGADGANGGQTFAASYAGLVTGVGARTAELKIGQEAAGSILTQAQANRDATSGVNLDEEAANLIRFEQAYNASAQVISVARSLFDSLLSAFR